MGLLQRCRSWLAWKRLWLSHVYPFYWAHKPLCQRFRRDVLRLGRVHVCRSCTMVYAGAALGAVLCGVFRQPLWDVAPALWAAMAGITLVFSFPLWYKRWPRPMRDLLRAMLGGTIALCGYLLLSGAWLPGLVGTAVLAASWQAYRGVRERFRRQACAGCPELRDGEICPGFALQAERIRQYEQQATERLIAGGYVPDA